MLLLLLLLPPFSSCFSQVLRLYIHNVYFFLVEKKQKKKSKRLLEDNIFDMSSSSSSSSSCDDSLQLKADLMATSEYFPRTSAFLDTVYELVSSITTRQREETKGSINLFSFAYTRTHGPFRMKPIPEMILLN